MIPSTGGAKRPKWRRIDVRSLPVNLHRNFMLAGGPLIAAFVEMPAEDGKQMSELDRRINAPSSREALCRL
jgi:hypothetical protein